MIIVKNSKDPEWNGEYIEGNVKHKDSGSVSYVKDARHHIYKSNNVWRLAENCVKCYKTLGHEIGDVIDFDNLHDNSINICFCSDEKLISYIPVVINSSCY